MIFCLFKIEANRSAITIPDNPAPTTITSYLEMSIFTY